MEVLCLDLLPIKAIPASVIVDFARYQTMWRLRKTAVMLALPLECWTQCLIAHGVHLFGFLSLWQKQAIYDFEDLGNLLLAVKGVDCFLLRKVKATHDKLGSVWGLSENDFLFAEALQETNGLLELHVFLLDVFSNARLHMVHVIGLTTFSVLFLLIRIVIVLLFIFVSSFSLNYLKSILFIDLLEWSGRIRFSEHLLLIGVHFLFFCFNFYL